ncbi:MAG: hypothetical protein K2K91_00780 [Ruminococcus sp.]|nr:hypothetical protein [Ruminococcus sp.]
MNCKLCGCYYSTHEQEKNCPCCSGNREGLHKTKLITISKFLAVTALIIHFMILIFSQDIRDELMTSFRFITNDYGNSPDFALLYLILPNTYLHIIPVYLLNLPPVYLLTIIALLMTQKCSSVLYLMSAIMLILPAIFIFLSYDNDSIVYSTFFAIPCLLITMSAVITRIDRKKQI